MECSIPGFPVHHQLLELAQTHLHLVGDAIQTSHPLSSPSPPAFNLSQHQGLSNESALLIRWPKYWSFSFNISPSKEYLGLISFRIDWLDLLAVQGTLKSFLQHHSSKASVLEAVLRRQKNSTGRPLSPPAVHRKNIWTLSKFHKTTFESWQRTSGTQKGSPLSLKGSRTKYKR